MLKLGLFLKNLFVIEHSSSFLSANAIWLAIVNLFSKVINFFATIFWAVSKVILGIMEGFEYICHQFLGVGSNVDDYVVLGKEIKTNGTNDFLQTFTKVFKTVAIVSILLLIIFTIFAIIKQEWDHANSGFADPKANSKKGFFVKLITSTLSIVALPLTMIFLVAGVNSALTSFAEAVNANSGVTIAGQVLFTSTYDANKFRTYANANQRVPIIVTAYNSTDIKPDEYQKMQIEIQSSVVQNKLRTTATDLANGTLLSFEESLTYQNNKFYNTSAYGDYYEKFVATAEQYQVMADFVDYAQMHNLNYTVKSIDEEDIEWKYVHSTVYNSAENRLDISYTDTADYNKNGSKSDYYTMTLVAKNEVTSPISDALDSIMGILGVGEYSDNMYNTMERDDSGEFLNLVQWANEKVKIQLSKDFELDTMSTWTDTDEIIVYEFYRYASNNTFGKATLEDLMYNPNEDYGIELDLSQITYRQYYSISDTYSDIKTIYCVLINGNYYNVHKTEDTDVYGNAYYKLTSLNSGAGLGTEKLNHFLDPTYQVLTKTGSNTTLELSSGFNINNPDSWKICDQILVYEYYKDLSYNNDFSAYKFSDFDSGVTFPVYKITTNKANYVPDAYNNKTTEVAGYETTSKNYVYINGTFYELTSGNVLPTGTTYSTYGSFLTEPANANSTSYLYKLLTMEGDNEFGLNTSYDYIYTSGTIFDSTNNKPKYETDSMTGSGTDSDPYKGSIAGVTYVNSSDPNYKKYSGFSLKLSDNFYYADVETWSFKDYFIFYLYSQYQIFPSIDYLKNVGIEGSFVKIDNNYCFETKEVQVIKGTDDNKYYEMPLYIKLDAALYISELNVLQNLDAVNSLNNVDIDTEDENLFISFNSAIGDTLLIEEMQSFVFNMSDGYDFYDVSTWTVEDYILTYFSSCGILPSVEVLEAIGYEALVYKVVDGGYQDTLYRFGREYNATNANKTLYLSENAVLKHIKNSADVTLQFSSLEKWLSMDLMSFISKKLGLSTQTLISTSEKLTGNLYTNAELYIKNYDELVNSLIADGWNENINEISSYVYTNDKFDYSDLSTWTILDLYMYVATGSAGGYLRSKIYLDSAGVKYIKVGSKVLDISTAGSPFEMTLTLTNTIESSVVSSSETSISNYYSNSLASLVVTSLESATKVSPIKFSFKTNSSFSWGASGLTNFDVILAQNGKSANTNHSFYIHQSGGKYYAEIGTNLYVKLDNPNAPMLANYTTFSQDAKMALKQSTSISIFTDTSDYTFSSTDGKWKTITSYQAESTNRIKFKEQSLPAGFVYNPSIKYLNSSDNSEYSFSEGDSANWEFANGVYKAISGNTLKIANQYVPVGYVHNSSISVTYMKVDEDGSAYAFSSGDSTNWGSITSYQAKSGNGLKFDEQSLPAGFVYNPNVKYLNSNGTDYTFKVTDTDNWTFANGVYKAKIGNTLKIKCQDVEAGFVHNENVVYLEASGTYTSFDDANALGLSTSGTKYNLFDSAVYNITGNTLQKTYKVYKNISNSKKYIICSTASGDVIVDYFNDSDVVLASTTLSETTANTVVDYLYSSKYSSLVRNSVSGIIPVEHSSGSSTTHSVYYTSNFNLTDRATWKPLDIILYKLGIIGKDNSDKIVTAEHYSSDGGKKIYLKVTTTSTPENSYYIDITKIIDIESGAISDKSGALYEMFLTLFSGYDADGTQLTTNYKTFKSTYTTIFTSTYTSYIKNLESIKFAVDSSEMFFEKDGSYGDPTTWTWLELLYYQKTGTFNNGSKIYHYFVGNSTGSFEYAEIIATSGLAYYYTITSTNLNSTFSTTITDPHAKTQINLSDGQDIIEMIYVYLGNTGNTSINAGNGNFKGYEIIGLDGGKKVFYLIKSQYNQSYYGVYEYPDISSTLTFKILTGVSGTFANVTDLNQLDLTTGKYDGTNSALIFQYATTTYTNVYQWSLFDFFVNYASGEGKSKTYYSFLLEYNGQEYFVVNDYFINVTKLRDFIDYYNNTRAPKYKQQIGSITTDDIGLLISQVQRDKYNNTIDPNYNNVLKYYNDLRGEYQTQVSTQDGAQIGTTYKDLEQLPAHSVYDPNQLYWKNNGTPYFFSSEDITTYWYYDTGDKVYKAKEGMLKINNNEAQEKATLISFSAGFDASDFNSWTVSDFIIYYLFVEGYYGTNEAFTFPYKQPLGGYVSNQEFSSKYFQSFVNNGGAPAYVVNVLKQDEYGAVHTYKALSFGREPYSGKNVYVNYDVFMELYQREFVNMLVEDRVNNEGKPILTQSFSTGSSSLEEFVYAVQASGPLVEFTYKNYFFFNTNDDAFNALGIKNTSYVTNDFKKEINSGKAEIYGILNLQLSSACVSSFTSALTSTSGVNTSNWTILDYIVLYEFSRGAEVLNFEDDSPNANLFYNLKFSELSSSQILVPLYSRNDGQTKVLALNGNYYVFDSDTYLEIMGADTYNFIKYMASKLISTSSDQNTNDKVVLKDLHDVVNNYTGTFGDNSFEKYLKEQLSLLIIDSDADGIYDIYKQDDSDTNAFKPDNETYAYYLNKKLIKITQDYINKPNAEKTENGEAFARNFMSALRKLSATTVKNKNYIETLRIQMSAYMQVLNQTSISTMKSGLKINNHTILRSDYSVDTSTGEIYLRGSNLKIGKVNVTDVDKIVVGAECSTSISITSEIAGYSILLKTDSDNKVKGLEITINNSSNKIVSSGSVSEYSFKVLYEKIDYGRSLNYKTHATTEDLDKKAETIGLSSGTNETTYRTISQNTKQVYQISLDLYPFAEVSKVVREVSWPQKLMNDMQVLYPDLNWATLIATDGWLDTLGDYTSAYTNGLFETSGNSSNTTAAGLVLSEFFLSVANKSQSYDTIAKYEYSSLFDENVIKSLMLSMLGEESYNNLSQQASVFMQMFNTCFAPILDDIAYEQSINIVDGQVSNFVMCVYKSFLATTLLSSDLGEYLYTIATRIYAEYTVYEYLASAAGDYGNYLAYVNDEPNSDGDLVDAFEYAEFHELVRYENGLSGNSTPVFSFSLLNTLKTYLKEGNSVLGLSSSSSEEAIRTALSNCYGNDTSYKNLYSALFRYVDNYYKDTYGSGLTVPDDDPRYCFMLETYWAIYYQLPVRKDQDEPDIPFYLEYYRDYLEGDVSRWNITKSISIKNASKYMAKHDQYVSVLKREKVTTSLAFANLFVEKSYDDTSDMNKFESFISKINPFDDAASGSVEELLLESLASSFSDELSTIFDRFSPKEFYEDVMQELMDGGTTYWDYLNQLYEIVPIIIDEVYELQILPVSQEGTECATTENGSIKKYDDFVYAEIIGYLDTFHMGLSNAINARSILDQITKASISFTLGQYGQSYVTVGYDFNIENRNYTFNANLSAARFAEYVYGGSYLADFGIEPIYTNEDFEGLIRQSKSYNSSLGQMQIKLDMWPELRSFASEIANYTAKLYYMTNLPDIAGNIVDGVKLTDYIYTSLTDTNHIKATPEFVILKYLIEESGISADTFARLMIGDTAESIAPIEGYVNNNLKNYIYYICGASNSLSLSDDQKKQAVLDYLYLVNSANYDNKTGLYYNKSGSVPSNQRVHEMFENVIRYLIVSEDSEDTSEEDKINLENITFKDFKIIMMDKIVDYQENPSETTAENTNRYIALFNLITAQFNFSTVEFNGGTLSIGETVGTLLKPYEINRNTNGFVVNKENANIFYHVSFEEDQSTKDNILKLAGLSNRPIEELVGLEYDSLYNRNGLYDEAKGDIFVICTFDNNIGKYIPVLARNNKLSLEQDFGIQVRYTDYTDYYNEYKINFSTSYYADAKFSYQYNDGVSDITASEYLAYPIIAKGIIDSAGYPTAIRLNNGKTEYYRTDIVATSMMNSGAVAATAGVAEFSTVNYTNFVESTTYQDAKGQSTKTTFIGSHDVKNYLSSDVNICLLQRDVKYVFATDDYGGISILDEFSAYYLLSGQTTILLVLGMSTILPLLFNATAAVLRRILDLFLLILMGPVVISMRSIDTSDNGKGVGEAAFNNWKKMVESTLIMGFGLVIGFNVFYMLSSTALQTTFISDLTFENISKIGGFKFLTKGLLESILKYFFIIGAAAFVKTSGSLLTSVITNGRVSNPYASALDGKEVMSSVKSVVKEVKSKAKSAISGQGLLDARDYAMQTAKSMVPGSALAEKAFDKSTKYLRKAKKLTQEAQKIAAEAAIESAGDPKAMAVIAAKKAAAKAAEEVAKKAKEIKDQRIQRANNFMSNHYASSDKNAPKPEPFKDNSDGVIGGFGKGLKAGISPPKSAGRGFRKTFTKGFKTGMSPPPKKGKKGKKK